MSLLEQADVLRHDMLRAQLSAVFATSGAVVDAIRGNQYLPGHIVNYPRSAGLTDVTRRAIRHFPAA